AGLTLVAAAGYAGLVIGTEDPRAFSSGANIGMLLTLAQEGAWDEIELALRQFQRASMSIRYAPFPVVVAPAGMTLGAGAEFMLHADQVQAGGELYTGLVETGIGIIPAGGGTKELLFRFTQELVPYQEADPFEGVRRAFNLIALATTSGSAPEARKLGMLRDRDRISMNRDLLIADAKAGVLSLAADYVPPTPPRITALGREALGNLRFGVWAMREGGQITDHEVEIGNALAYVLCGGDGPPREVSEQDILDLEREAALRLVGMRKTQERIAHTLKTGRPLRN
ncbi:MAG TPA: enoyl-CoA hydratase-related protein, partial [Thermomicrobiaceae bacterium]|nr:enoyl-CoA hydratase-related protein [Thermomicrobiaceae bacterium]